MKLSTWRWPDAAAETARLAAKYSFGPKAAMTAQVKAARQVVAKKRKDRLTAPVRCRPRAICMARAHRRQQPGLAGAI